MEANWRIRKEFSYLSEEDLSSLRLFHVELLRFNQTLNLISTFTEKNADYIHFYDCIKAFEFINKEISRDEIYDLGSGNGFPGIIFSLLDKNRKYYLVEVDERKSEFLKHICSRAEIKNAEVLNIKAETLNITKPVSVVCRAFSNLARTLLLGNKVFTKDTDLYSLKGPDWFTELTSLPSQICSTWNTKMAFEYSLPDNLGERYILKSDKISD